MIPYLALFIISLAVLVFASDWFIGAAEKIGLGFGISPFVIGVTIVAFGTSLPELATSIAGIYEGASDVVIGNVLGSNITNILLVLGLTAVMGKGIMRIVPIIVGIIVGYIAALILGPIMGVDFVNTAAIADAKWFAIPDFVAPEFKWAAILFLLPVAIAPAIEHFGDIMAISSVTKRDYMENPGIQNTMLGDGLATTAAGLLGGPPNTTYSEVTGAVALTKSFNPAIMTWTAIFAIILAFVGKLGGALATIPMPVMGGIMVLMFGMVTMVGASVLAKVEDLTEARNMAIASVILVIGVGGLSVPFGGDFVLGGIGLAGIVGLVLNMVLPRS